MLKFYSASTSIVDTKRAISECIENAFSGEPDHDCDLLVIYSAMGHNFHDLLFEAKRLCPSALITGCTGSGVIGKEGPDESIKALAIMAVKGDTTLFAASGRENIRNADYYSISREMAFELKEHCPALNMIIMYQCITLHNSASQLIRGIESVCGNIPVIGAVSMDNFKMVTGIHFMGDRIFENGLIMIGLGDPELEVISHASHGFDVFGDPFIITKTDQGRILELDGKPAWKRWTERLGLPETTPSREVLPIAPLAYELDPELHEIYENKYLLFGSVPESDNSIFGIPDPVVGQKIWLARRNEKRINDGIERMLINILDNLNGRIPVAVLHADCAARGKLLFNKVIKEEMINQMQFPLCHNENIPWFGIYGGSEYTPINGRNMIHAFTTSLFVLTRRKPEREAERIELNINIADSSPLFKASVINNIQLKSRFIRSSTWLGVANFDGTISPQSVSKLLPVSRSGVGMIMSEMLYVNNEGICAPGMAGISDEIHIPGLKRMTDFVHRSGCPITAQLCHGGLMALPALSGSAPLGPSPMQTPQGTIGREMNADEIKSVVLAFAEAAIRARNAGFDGVEIHAAHGFLLSEFLSPFFNKRTDKYGGSPENRAKLLIEVIRTTKAAVGKNLALFVKINSEDLLPGGLGIKEMVNAALMIEEAGADALEVSGGTLGAFLMGDAKNSFSPSEKEDVYYREAARVLKKTINIPVILVGGIRTFEEAEEIITSGTADYISLSRPLIREPDLILKWKSGNLKRSACISETACMMEGAQGRGVHCIHVQNT